MAPKTYNPYRKCDFCGANNFPTYYTRYERRAWTLHHHSNKMTCPNCRVKGMDAERKAIAEVVRHRVAMDAISAAAEPEGEYHRGTEAQRAQGNGQLGVLCDPVPLWCASEPPAVYGVNAQYTKIKAQYPDAVLLFRLADEYIALNADADLLHEKLGLAVEQYAPTDTCAVSFPAHALETYLPQLVKKYGLRVAICDRLETDQLLTENHRGTEAQRNEQLSLLCAPVPLWCACEPPALYGERPKDKRYREIEKGKVIARLEDIAGVLRRHNALKDSPALAKYLDDIRESVANDNLMADIAQVREELSLRAVWISHQGRIICRVDGCWWKFNAGSVLELIAEAKKLYSGRVLSEALPKMGSARMRFDDELLLDLAEHNARVAAKSHSPALRTYFNNLLEKVREAMGEQRSSAVGGSGAIAVSPEDVQKQAA